MALDPKLRRKKRSKKDGGGGALMLNIRVRHIRKRGAPPTTRTQVRDALQYLLDNGSMPSGWQFMYVDWKNPAKYGSGWVTGVKSSDDTDEFMHAFRAIVQHEIRVAVVEKVPK